MLRSADQNIDIEVPNIRAEATRLSALGARPVSENPCSEHVREM